ncbi:MAG: esterase/lipase superfamily enzyme [Paracoccaceae bacterium]|jgi:esterase/lipase superfamily enzyme
MRVFLFLVAGMLALTACADRSFTPTVPDALQVGTPFTLFTATTRAKNPDGSYGYERSEKLALLEMTVSIPPSHTPGELEFAYARPDPQSQFTMAARHEIPSKADFRTRLNTSLASLPADQREVTVFVHGYNATQAETAFRAAQLANDINLPGTMVVYSWPSQGRALGYAYDNDSLLFARDGLEQLLFELHETQARRIILVAHSMGALLAMEALRGIELRRPGWSGKNIGGVMLISPDLDIEVFRSQIKSLSKVPQPFVVFVSEHDGILNLSARLRGTGDRERLGNISSTDEIADLPISIIDTTAFANEAGSSHFVAATSPTLVAMLNDAQTMRKTFGPEKLRLASLLPGEIVHLQGVTKITLSPAEEGPN